MGIGSNQSLDNLLQLAVTIYYGREYEEKKERQKKDKGIGRSPRNGYENRSKTAWKKKKKSPEGPKWKEMGLLLLWKEGAPQAELPSGI